MNLVKKHYLMNVLSVLNEIERLSLYSLEENKIEYRIVITKKKDIDPMDEWRIIKRLLEEGVVSEYDESDSYKSKVGSTVLDPVMVFFLSVDAQELKNHLERIKQKLRTEEFDESDLISWPGQYRWTSTKKYQAKSEIVFVDNNSNKLRIFRELVDAKGAWVMSKHLVSLLSIKTTENLRPHISELRTKLKGSGLTVEARGSRNKPGAYRVIPLS